MRFWKNPWEPVQVYRPVAVPPQANLAKRSPVSGKVALGDADLGPKYAVGAGHAY